MVTQPAPASRSRLDPWWWGELVVAFVAGYFAAALVMVSIPVVALGWRPTAVASDSMAPAIRSGDLVLVDPYASDIGPGAVIQFQTATGDLMLHRVVAVDRSGALATRGDANGDIDRSPVAPEDVVGRGVLMIPSLFHPLSGATLALVGCVGLWRLGQRVRSAPARRRLITALLATVAAGALVVPASRAAFAATTASPDSALTGAVLQPPTDLDATCSTVTLAEVDLTWGASPTPGVTHYDVLYGLDEAPNEVVATVPASQTTYTHTVLSVAGTHSYAVRAGVEGWASPLSNVDSVQISVVLICTD